jgi:non-ribosomal peptide synthetase-like protein
VVGKFDEVVPVDRAESPAARGGYALPPNGTEGILAEVLADVVHVEQVAADSHFFDDLGANSLVMAHFCARVRKRADVPPVSMKDIYRHPTIRSLATALADDAPTPVEPSVAASNEVAARASTLEYILCGALQLLTFVGYSYLTALIIVWGTGWVAAGSGLLDTYLRLVLAVGGGFVGLCILPILVKWVLVGRWKAQQIRIWSLAYVRFWIVKTLVQKNLVILLFLGSPLYVLYLKALGVKVGRGVAIFSRYVPVCTDLLTIGEGTVIRKDSMFNCYRGHAGLIQTGAVTLGKDVFVGEMSVIDIGTSLGDGAQLGHASSLHPGQAVPDGEHWHGSPAQRTDADYRAAAPTGCSTLRRAVYSVTQLLAVLLVYLPLAIGGVDLLLAEVPKVTTLLGTPRLAFTTWTFYRDALAVSFVLFFGAALVGLLFVATVPRLLNLAITPDKVYPLYGLHYSVHRAIRVITNLKFFITLFGDSSYIVHYLRYLGYDLSQVEQTGSNFGSVLKHETPYLSSVGTGTMIADGLSIINADFSSTSFRVSRASIGAHNFLGNNVFYPSQGKTGENCLLATKVLVPIDGDVREGVGLLGSPSFEIPRSVQRDHKFDHLRSGDALRRGLAAKNKHNAVTIVMFLLARWIYFFGVLLLGWAATDLYNAFGVPVIALAAIVALLFSVVYFALVERAAQVVHPLQPLYVSIYDRRFWRHERFWKAAAMAYVHAFNGTPFKTVVWRLLGIRLGRRLFDDGCAIPERTLVTIGDDCMLNAGSKLQCHSQEDGTFKTDRITIGAGCTLGTGALVHYGVTMADGAALAADSFVMKGEEVPPHARWAGNPARRIRDDQYQPA